MGDLVVDVVDKRDLYNGFGTTLARAFELVVTPLLFALLGHLLDGWLGTSPLFTVGLAVLGLAGTVVRMYYGYVADMERHTSQAAWTRR
ncbi:MAG: AtpZ/AtpI family protein [Acidimicrobiales bacterium]